MKLTGDDVGKRIGTSAWTSFSQGEINMFGEATRDAAPFHMDADWAREHSPFGKTVAYGFQTLSLLAYFTHEILDWPIASAGGDGYALNYGFDRVRFTAPVPVDTPFRCHLWLSAIEPRGEGRELRRFKVEIEVEGQAHPALIAEWLGLWVSAEGHAALADATDAQPAVRALARRMAGL